MSKGRKIMERSDLAGMAPAEIDEQWAKLDAEYHRERDRANNYHDLVAKIEAGEDGYQYYGDSMKQGYYEQAVEYEAKAAECDAQLAPLKAEWDRRGGWPRTWHVTNLDGHYHRTRSCTTTYPTTLWAWAPELAGKTDDELIEAVGCFACTRCYPDAPRHPKFLAMEAEQAAERAAKEAAKCSASGTYAPAGSYDHRLVSPFARCPECRGVVSITKTGKFRAHKPGGSK